MAQHQDEARVANLSRARIFLYSLLPLLFLVLLGEGGARVYERLHPGEVGQIDLSFGFSPDLHVFPLPPEGDPGKRMRFRRETGSPEERTFQLKKPVDTFRIFMLGGSSVAFLQKHFEALEKELNARYRNHPRIELINAGMWSYGSQRVMLVAREVMEYEPDLLVLYTGHNEFEDLYQFQLAEKGISPLQQMLAKSAVYRIFWHRNRQRQLEILQTGHNLDLLKGNPFPTQEEWKRNVSRGDISERMAAFQRNVEAIAALCKAREVPLIIGTVPSNYWVLAPESGMRTYNNRIVPLRDAGKYKEYVQAVEEFLAGQLRRQSSSSENAIIRKVAGKFSLPLADVLAAVYRAEPHGVPGETLFTDVCHLNDAGNDVWIQVYTPLILEQIDRRR